ncbi:hypothetical protein AB4059_02665 [Lysobacter sp. 2RAF19]
MHVATEDQMLDLTRTMLGMAAEKLSENRFEVFGLCVKLDGDLAHVVSLDEDEATIDGIAATCKRVQSACLAFGIFAMVEIQGQPDKCLFTMAIEKRCGGAVCSFGLIARGPDGLYDVEAGYHVPSTPGLFVMVRH